MAHVRLVTYSTPEQTATWYQEMLQRQYPVEGTLFRGFTSPQVSEVKLWDVRIKKEAVSQFLTDNMAHNLTSKAHVWDKKTGEANLRHHYPHGWFLRPIFWLYLKLTKQYIPEFALENPQRQLFTKQGWHYVFVIGCQNDPERTPGNEEL
jgi:hypothetical protein